MGLDGPPLELHPGSARKLRVRMVRAHAHYGWPQDARCVPCAIAAASCVLPVLVWLLLLPTQHVFTNVERNRVPWWLQHTMTGHKQKKQAAVHCGHPVPYGLPTMLGWARMECWETRIFLAMTGVKRQSKPTTCSFFGPHKDFWGRGVWRDKVPLVSPVTITRAVVKDADECMSKMRSTRPVLAVRYCAQVSHNQTQKFEDIQGLSSFCKGIFNALIHSAAMRAGKIFPSTNLFAIAPPFPSGYIYYHSQYSESLTQTVSFWMF